MVSVWLQDRDVVFLHVPKTAGGSISRALLEEPDAVNIGVRDMSVAVPCVEQLQAQLDVPLSSLRTVTCVRNPWDWTVSGWLHVTRNRPAYDDPPSFRDFVMGAWHGATTLQYPHKFTTPEAYVSYHTQITQWDHLGGAGSPIDIDAVCRFENLEVDFRDVFDTDKTLGHTNRSERAPYVTYYNEDTRQVVAERNEPLIERFGYRFDEPPR